MLVVQMVAETGEMMVEMMAYLPVDWKVVGKACSLAAEMVDSMAELLGIVMAAS